MRDVQVVCASPRRCVRWRVLKSIGGGGMSEIDHELTYDSLCTLVKEMLAERSMLMYLLNGGTQRENVAKIHQEDFTKRARKLGVDV